MGGRYRLIEKIGTGGMSDVWRGHDAVLGRPVAVKVLTEGHADDTAFRDRMRREARAAARLCHPQVNTVYDLTEDGNAAPYMVMELIDGPSLAERLRTGPLSWRQAAAICGEVAAGLAAAHAAGLVHRDVKPGNVMLGSTGAKLVDFGISAEIGEPGDHGHDGLVLGTPAYVAPERLTGAPALPASDVYALGVLLYKSLTGRLPWDVDTKSGVLRAHLLTSPRPLPYVEGLPAEVAEICHRALAKEPEARPSARELARVCHHAVEGTEDLTMLLGPVPAARLRAFQRVRALVHGPRRVGLAAAGVLALGAIAVTAASAQSTPRTAPAPVPAAVADTAACQVTYRLWTDDGHAFTGDLTVSNTGSDRLAGQDLTFTVPSNQQFIGDGWTQQGSAVRVQAGTLAPGGHQDLPFQGTYTGTNALPAAFTLGRSTCDPVLVGVSGVPAGAPAGNAPAAPANGPAAGAPAPQQPAPRPTKKHKKHGDGGD